MLDQHGLTYRTRNSSHEISINPIKKTKINYKIQFSINTMLKDKIKKIN
jgi:hypothetical protein